MIIITERIVDRWGARRGGAKKTNPPPTPFLFNREQRAGRNHGKPVAARARRRRRRLARPRAVLQVTAREKSCGHKSSYLLVAVVQRSPARAARKLGTAAAAVAGAFSVASLPLRQRHSVKDGRDRTGKTNWKCTPATKIPRPSS